MLSLEIKIGELWKEAEKFVVKNIVWQEADLGWIFSLPFMS